MARVAKLLGNAKQDFIYQLPTASEAVAAKFAQRGLQYANIMTSDRLSVMTFVMGNASW
jgi:hypothetical protein